MLRVQAIPDLLNLKGIHLIESDLVKTSAKLGPALINQHNCACAKCGYIRLAVRLNCESNLDEDIVYLVLLYREPKNVPVSHKKVPESCLSCAVSKCVVLLWTSKMFSWEREKF